MKLIEVLTALDQELDKMGEARTLFICGGASLILQGLVTRDTQDVDVLMPEIDRLLADSAKAVAEILALEPDWLNDGVSGIVPSLPTGWTSRTFPVFRGERLVLFSLGRLKMILTKAFAFCDRGEDRDDLLKLEPSAQEIAQATLWVSVQDAHPQWPEWVQSQMGELAKENSDE